MTHIMAAQETMWYPGLDYRGREHDPEYAQTVDHAPLTKITELVKKRAEEDGEWIIAQNLVGENADKMRRMVAWASKDTHIQQCVGHILKEEMESVRTVDWVCYDLGKASRFAVQ